MKSWHARVAVLVFSQVCVFNSFYLMREPTTKTRIERIVNDLMLDEQVEVTFTSAFILT